MALQINIIANNEQHVIKVIGEVDLYSSPELRAALTKALPAAGGGVAIDLSEVAYMDSSGVATLVEGLRAATRGNQAFTLISPSRSVMKVLQLSRLDSVFSIRESA